jgi:hypothetical protein
LRQPFRERGDGASFWLRVDRPSTRPSRELRDGAALARDGSIVKGEAMSRVLDLPPPAKRADDLWFLPKQGDGRYLRSGVGARHVTLGYISRVLYNRRSIEDARRDLVAWIAERGGCYRKLVAWAEETIEETLPFFRSPRQHHKRLKRSNMLERLSEETEGRTSAMRIFPISTACCRLIRALAVETRENWLEAHR